MQFKVTQKLLNFKPRNISTKYQVKPNQNQLYLFISANGFLTRFNE